MRRRLSTLFFAASVLMWIATIGIYIRSQFRADAITCITPWHHCLFVESADGMVRIYDQSPWPGSTRLKWSTGIPNYDSVYSSPDDTLRGPQIASIYDVAVRHYTWRRIGIKYGTAWLAQSFSIDTYARGLFIDDSSPLELHEIAVRAVWAPVWIVPLALAAPPGVWLTTVGRWRYRSRTRCRRGLCIRCGYDLRQTPSRCPECGD